MSDTDPKRKLDELEAKLAARRMSQKAVKSHQEEHYSQGQLAWRMVTEMVAGLGIGFGIGYGLDVLFGTTPFLMVLFTLLGIAAGINVMLRSAREIQAKQEAAASGEKTRGHGAADERENDGD